MRSDLETVPGLTNLTTDVPGRMATFNWDKKEADPELKELKAKLEEFAKDNEHVRGWSVME